MPEGDGRDCYKALEKECGWRGRACVLAKNLIIKHWHMGPHLDPVDKKTINQCLPWNSGNWNENGMKWHNHWERLNQNEIFFAFNQVLRKYRSYLPFYLRVQTNLNDCSPKVFSIFTYTIEGLLIWEGMFLQHLILFHLLITCEADFKNKDS